MQATIVMLIEWPLPVNMAIFANEQQAMVVQYIIMMAVPFLSRNTFTKADYYDEAGYIFCQDNICKKLASTTSSVVSRLTKINV